MDPATAASTLATLVGLICNWKTERGAAATDKFQDFLTYLSEHQFEAIRTDIASSQELQLQLRGLLMLNLEHIGNQLDLLSQGIAALASKIEGVAPVAQAMQAKGEQLSEQATQILKVLDQTESQRMVNEPGRDDSFIFMPSNITLSFTEKRFIASDLQSLLDFGLIEREHFPDPRTKSYTITRLGSRLASQMPKVDYDRPKS